MELHVAACRGASRAHARGRLASPINATIYVQLTEGVLIGSQRMIDPAKSWYADGELLMPYHPYSVFPVFSADPPE